MAMKPTSFNSDNFRSTEEWHKGERAEDVIKRVLREEDFYVYALSDISERGNPGAPGARNDHDFIVLPDLDISGKGWRGFAEVKGKSEPTFTRTTGQYEHGIPLNSYKMYQRIKEETGAPVFLFIYEFKSGAILFSEIDDLETRIYYGNKMSKGGMAFFFRSSFDLWGKVALVNGTQANQLDFFPIIEGKGRNLFKLTRHHKEFQLAVA